jgi:hypothetical protein
MISKAKSKRFLASSLLTLVAAIASAHAEYAGGNNPALQGGAYPAPEDLFPMTRRLTTVLDTPGCYEYNPTDENDFRYRHPAELSIVENCPVTTSCTANDLTPLRAR